jgi:hypothetical protein
MSIAPIQGFPALRNEPSSNPGVPSSALQAHPASAVAEGTATPVSGTTPKQEKSVAKNSPSTGELPEDVVEVHQDPDRGDQVIIQYLDQSKDVILQVPSQQELDVQRGIAAEFEQAAKLRVSERTVAARSEGEKAHGNQL